MLEFIERNFMCMTQNKLKYLKCRYAILKPEIFSLEIAFSYIDIR